MKNHLRKTPFTLVEVLIAMGICVVGVVSVMGLFPVGANTARDANMAFYADQAADQMLHFAKRASELSDNYFLWFTGWPIDIDDSTISSWKNDSDKKKFFENPTNDEEPETTLNIDDWKDKNGSLATGLPTGLKEFLTNNNFQAQYIQIDPVNSSNGRKIIRCVFKTNIGSVISDDFDCIVHLWATPLYAEEEGKTRLPDAATFHAEISWPAAIPYENRQKSEYSLDVFLPPLP